jgi:hypothetical protein
LSVSALAKMTTEYVIVEEKFLPQSDTINTEKRYTIIKFILILYSSRLFTATKSSKTFFCEMCLK